MDKLTQAVTVKLSPETATGIRLVGESAGMELSEYIRHLIAADLERCHRKYEVLHQVFGQAGPLSTFTKGDAV